MKDFFSYFFLINSSISILKTTLSCDNFSYLDSVFSDILMQLRNKADDEQLVKSRPGVVAASWSMVLCTELGAGSRNCEK